MGGSSQRYAGTDRFQIVRHLGSGAMGEVFEAIDQESGQPVALKTLPRVDGESLHRFKREFRSLADVHHQHLVGLRELVYDELADQWFFTMDLLRGVDLRSYLAPSHSGVWNPAELEKPVDDGALRSVFRQLALGVSAIHAAGKLHRDLKPTNVMVDGKGHLKILDFGLATDATDSGLESTIEASVVGTPAYMSPEQAAGEPPSPASDWYAVGVMLFEALTGELPFRGSLLRVLTVKREQEAPAARSLNPRVAADLDLLCQRLLQRSPAERAGATEVFVALGGIEEERAPTTRPAHEGFFARGRDRELTRLRSLLADVSPGKPAIVWIQGTSGIGKTTLVERFLAQLQAREIAVLQGRSYERESVPFKAFDSLVDSLAKYLRRSADVDELVPVDIAALSRVFPVLERVDAVAKRADAILARDPHEQRRRMFACLKDLFRRIGRSRRVVLFLDDVHWGDADSAALLSEILAPPDAPPVLVIACSQTKLTADSVMYQMLTERRRNQLKSVTWHDMELRPLDFESSAELARHLLGSAPNLVGLAENIARESEGSPYFLEEMVRYARAGHQDSSLGSLNRALQRRIAALPEQARLALRLLSLAGRPIAVQELLDACGADDAIIARLRALGLVRTRGGRARDLVEVCHDRVRVAVVQELADDDVAALKGRLTVAREAAGGATDEELAQHCLATGQIDKARDYARKAALAASVALAFNEAARLFELALSLSHEERSLESELQEGLGDALGNAGRGKDAAEALLAASAGAEPARAQGLQQRAAQYLLYAGHVDDALATLRRVLSNAGMPLAKGPRRALASLLWRRSRIRMMRESFHRRPASEIEPAKLAAIDVCWHTATGLLPIDTIHGLDLQSRHLRLAMEAGDPYRMARALAIESGAIATAGHAKRGAVRELLERAGELARDVANPHALGLVDMCAGVADYLLGRWPESIRNCDLADKRFAEECTGRAWEMHNSRRFALGSLYYHGELRELHDRVHRWLNDAIERGDLYASTNIRTGPCNAIWLALDDPDSAREQVRSAVREWSQGGYHTQHFYSLYSEVNIDQYCEEPALAWQRLLDAWPSLKRSLLMRTQLIRSEAHWLRGRTALSLAAHRARSGAPVDSALQAEARRASKLLTQEGPHYTSGLAALLQAEALLVEHQREHALAELRRAEDCFDQAAMLLFVHTCRVLLARGHGQSVPDGTAAWFAQQGIVDRERFMALVAPTALQLLSPAPKKADFAADEPR